MKQFYYIVVFVFNILYLNTCTENPFFEDKIDVQKNRIIRGKVDLGYGTIPNNVYIWLEGLNLSDWTDNDGRFSIELPPAESQPGDGLNGIYRVYIYTANYQINIYNLLIINGEFDYNNEILDRDGNFKNVISLQKILDIQTTISPEKIYTTNKDPISFQIRIESLIDSVIVKTHINNHYLPSSLVFLKQGDVDENAIFIQGNPAYLATMVIKDIQYWTMTYVFPSNFFNEGVYKTLPYIQIIQDDLPEELLLSIDNKIFTIDYSFLKWPIKQQYGYLNVVKLSN